MYLLYFIAFVTLRVTSANNTPSIRPIIGAKLTEILEKNTPIFAIECLQKHFNLSDDDILEIFEVCIDESTVKDVVKTANDSAVIIKLRGFENEKVSMYEQQIIADGINYFTETLFKTVAAEGKWKPLVISGFSAHAALSLAASLSKGDTFEIMRSVLGPLQYDIPYDFVSYRALIEIVKSFGPSVLNLEFEYFRSRKMKKVKCGLKNHAEKIFLTNETALDFNKSLNGSKQYIFDWFMNESHTTLLKGRKHLQRDLHNIVDKINSNTNIIIGTAGYLKLQLQRGLKLEDHQIFQDNDDPDGGSVIEFFSGEGIYAYGVLDQLSATFIELPLKVKKSAPAMSLIVIRPNEVGGCDEVIKNLKEVGVEGFLKGKKQRVKILMPKAIFVTTLELNDPLAEMGLKEVLNPGVEFDGIIEHDVLPIDKIYQKNLMIIENNGDPGDDLEPLKPYEKLVKFTVMSSYIFAVIIKEPIPLYGFVGRSQ